MVSAKDLWPSKSAIRIAPEIGVRTNKDWSKEVPGSNTWRWQLNATASSELFLWPLPDTASMLDKIVTIGLVGPAAVLILAHHRQVAGPVDAGHLRVC